MAAFEMAGPNMAAAEGPPKKMPFHNIRIHSTSALEEALGEGLSNGCSGKQTNKTNVSNDPKFEIPSDVQRL